MLPIQSNQTALARDAALVASNVLNFEELAALHGLPVSELLEKLRNSEIRALIEQEAVRLKMSGALAEARAASLLNQALDAIEQIIKTGDLSWSAAVKLTELLVSVSGIRERRKEQARPEQGGFSITINLGPNPTTLTADGFEPRNMGDAEVIDHEEG